MELEENISQQNKDKIDNVLAYVFVKKLIKPINTTEPYKLGLVDNEGKLLREPETDEEKRALSIFDRIVFKIKRMLGSRIGQLNAFIYLKSLDDDFYDNMVITGALSKKSAIRRMESDIENVLEQYDITSEQLFNMIIAEQYRKKTKNEE